MISFISYTHPKILIGYSNLIEELMNKDFETFVRNIKKEVYPTPNGTWD